MNIAIVGTGYVGLVTGTCLAEIGNRVVCVDIDEAKIAALQAGHVPIYEPQLEELIARNTTGGRLSFTTSLAEGMQEADAIFLALPTPPKEDGSANLSYIFKVADDIGPLLSRYTVVVSKSTVPVGTAEQIAERIHRHAKNEFDVVTNPEFLREGFAVEDFMKPDRIIIGTGSKQARRVMEELYGPLIREGSPFLAMDQRSAEMTKYAANAFLATKISFINEMANLSEKLGADIDAVRLGIGADTRIGHRFLHPGPGYGGSCFPKDVAALQKTAGEQNDHLQILEAVADVNAAQRRRMADKVKAYYESELSGKKLAVWGLAFKANTDDIRESPAVEVVDNLLKSGAIVVAYDPEAMTNVKKLYPDRTGLAYAMDEYAALEGADALIVMTEWAAFQEPDFGRMKTLLKVPVIFDARNLYDVEEMKRRGFYYNSIGRRTVDAR